MSSHWLLVIALVIFLAICKIMPFPLAWVLRVQSRRQKHLCGYVVLVYCLSNSSPIKFLFWLRCAGSRTSELLDMFILLRELWVVAVNLFSPQFYIFQLSFLWLWLCRIQSQALRIWQLCIPMSFLCLIPIGRRYLCVRALLNIVVVRGTWLDWAVRVSDRTNGHVGFHWAVQESSVWSLK